MIVQEPNNVYHSNPAISKSRLSNMKVNPQYFKYVMENPPEKTYDLTLGSAFHKLVLEEEDFDNEFYVINKINKRTKEGQQLYAQALQEAGEKEIIEVDDYELISNMRESIMEDVYAKAMLKDGVSENSIYFNDPLTGTACKCRPDYLRTIGNKKLIVDLKSCQKADTDSCAANIVKFSYDLQAYIYSLGVSLEYGIDIKDVDFVFIFVEKTAPYLKNVVQADEYVLKRGKELYREYIGKYVECSKTGDWYGYNGFSHKPNLVSLPNYLLKQYIED